MARHSVPPPKPKSPILTVGQKRRRASQGRRARIHSHAVQSGRDTRLRPLTTNTTLRSPVLRPVGGPGRHDAQLQSGVESLRLALSLKRWQIHVPASEHQIAHCVRQFV
jgi:hypothetical protein